MQTQNWEEDTEWCQLLDVSQSSAASPGSWAAVVVLEYLGSDHDDDIDQHEDIDNHDDKHRNTN